MIIALSGKKRSGKDTFYTIASDYMRNNHPEIPVIKFSFAGVVKEYAQNYFHVDVLNESDKEKTRFVLQGIGQMMRDEVDEDYWVKTVEEKIERYNKSIGNYLGIITDTRYRNEAEWALQKTNHLIRIVSPLSPTDDVHPSEIELDDFPFEEFIYNNGSLEDYRKAVLEWIKKEYKYQ